MKKLSLFSLILVVLLAVGSHLYGEEPVKRQQTPDSTTAAPAYGESSSNDITSLRQGRANRDRRTAGAASQTRIFPWLGLATDYNKELRLEDVSGNVNRSRVMVRTGLQMVTWDIGLSQATRSTMLPRNSSALAVRSLRPSRTAVVWKRQDKVEWYDEGEEGPPIDFSPGSYLFLLKLQGEGAVALQFKLDGTDFKVVRSRQLRPSVSLLSRPHQGKDLTKVALLATDLRPLDSQFALLITEDAEALPHMLEVLASDAEGNAVPVQIEFNLSTIYSE